jgi:hypothetical protein
VLEDHRHTGDRLRDAFIADADFAGIVRQETVDAAQHGGLAAARGTDDCDDLALTDVEVDVAEDLERAVALAQTADADARLTFGNLRRRGGSDGGRHHGLTGHSAACFAGLALILAQ